MSDTHLSKNIAQVYCGPANRKELSESIETAEAVIPSGTCRVSSNKLYLTKNSDASFAGIVHNEDDHDLATAYGVSAAGAVVRCHIYPRGSGQLVWAWYEAQSPAANLVFGDQMALGASDSMTIKFAYANAAQATDSTINIVGNCQSLAITGSVSNNQLYKLRLGI